MFQIADFGKQVLSLKQPIWIHGADWFAGITNESGIMAARDMTTAPRAAKSKAV